MTGNITEKQNVMGHALALITVFIWGTTFISTKILLLSFSPIEILFIRFVLGWMALSLAYPRRLVIKDRKQELYFAAAGLCGVTLYFLLENIALTYTLASNVGVIASIAPFFIAIFAHLFLKGEKLRMQFFVGFVFAIVGIFLISFNGKFVLEMNLFGDLLAVLATITWGIYSILTKKIGEFQYNTIQMTRRIFSYGLVFMIPALFLFDFNPDIHQLVQPVNLFNILFLGFGASALCFASWNSAVKILGAIRTSVYIYMVPVITVITSAIVLQERISGIAVFGIIFTLAGLLLSEQRTTLEIKRYFAKNNAECKNHS